MLHEQLDRRHMLKGAGAVGLGALMAMAPRIAAADAQPPSGPGPVGSWDLRISLNGDGSGEGVVSFGFGGTVSLITVGKPGTWLGSWAATGPNFSSKAVIFNFNTSQVLIGKTISTAQGTVDNLSDTISGSFTNVTTDTAGNFVSSQSGTFAGNRPV
jgi:hypothetical protein